MKVNMNTNQEKMEAEIEARHEKMGGQNRGQSIRGGIQDGHCHKCCPREDEGHNNGWPGANQSSNKS
jgi:hypothetical protein